MITGRPKVTSWAATHMIKPEAGPELVFDDEGDWANGSVENLVGSAALEKAIELLELVTDDRNGGQAKLSAVDLSEFLEPFIGIRIKPRAFLDAACEVVEHTPIFNSNVSIQKTRRGRAL